MRDRWLALCVCLLALPAAQAGNTVGYGEIQIEIVSEPKGDARHGYAEYSFLVSNTSNQPHTVSLVLPAENYGGTNELRAVRRSVEVGAKETAPMSLYQPPAPPIHGNAVRVVIDGKEQEALIPLDVRNVQERAGTTPRYYSAKTVPLPLVLLSPNVEQQVVDTIRNQQVRVLVPRPADMPKRRGPFREDEPPPGFKDAPPVEPRPAVPGAREFETVTLNFNHVRAEGSMKNWPANWLGYSRYDAVIITRKDLLDLAESARPALWQYVETGGTLLVVGEAPVEDRWKEAKAKQQRGFKLYQPGFGVCVVAVDPLPAWKDELFLAFGESLKFTGSPIQLIYDVNDANKKFPVVDDVGIPVRGLFVLMLVFAIVIGPVNVALLTRWRKRLWLLWTVPALSFLTVFAVFGYMLLSEGWSRHLRTETVTVLDENTRRASTVGWTAFYSPVTPGDGLHFSYDTELTQQGELADEDPYYSYRKRRSAASGRTCTVNWSTDQHLDKGWVTARIPSHFQVRKSETTHLRVSVRKNRDGSYRAVNSLGVDIQKLWFADGDNRLYSAESVVAGSSAKLSATGKGLKEPSTPTGRDLALRYLYSGDWLSAAESLRESPEAHLKPLSYLAEVEDSPFLEDGLRNARERNCRSVILGILKELDHED